MPRKLTFSLFGDVETLVTVTQNGDGTLTFEIAVQDTGNIGDLRAVFFDLNGLTVDDQLSVHGGVDVTDWRFEEEGIDTLGRDANIKGAVSNALGDFDVGIEFGTSGTSADDIQSTSFLLRHASLDLTLDMISLADFGLRYTSVGTGEDRNGSAKLGGTAGGVAVGDSFSTTEDAALTLTATQLLANDEGDTGGSTISHVDTTSLLGSLTINPDGSYTYDAGGQFDGLGAGDTATETFSYTSTNAGGGTSTATVTITVTGIDNGPALFTDGADVVDFDDVAAGTYLDGSQYDALDGNDRISLPTTQAEAFEAGFDLAQPFNAGAGNDTVFASNAASAVEGGDTIVDGQGNDTLMGGGDGDRIFSTSGNNVIDGGDGADILSYQRMTTGVTIDIAAGTTLHAKGWDVFTGFETYDGSNFDDVFLGSDERDVIRDFAGNDRMEGLGGNDIFQVFEGEDTVLGGDGDDNVTLNRSQGAKVLDGGGGRDGLQLALLAEAVTVNLDAGTLQIGGTTSSITNFEVLYLTKYGDSYVGSAGDDAVYGAGGDDILAGLSGADTFIYDLRLDNGSDRITDFDVTEDVLRINFSSNYGPAYSGIYDLDLQQTTDGNLIAYVNGDTLLLQDVIATDLTDANLNLFL